MWQSVPWKSIRRVAYVALIYALVWSLTFGVRVWVRYNALYFDYRRAKQRLSVLRPDNAKDMYIAYGSEIHAAEALLEVGRSWRAVMEEWSSSYLCGAKTCTEFVLGDIGLRNLLLYAALLLMATSVLRVRWLASRPRRYTKAAHDIPKGSVVYARVDDSDNDAYLE